MNKLNLITGINNRMKKMVLSMAFTMAICLTSIAILAKTPVIGIRYDVNGPLPAAVADRNNGSGYAVFACSITSVTANPGACNPSTNNYNLTGTITYSNPPATGTLVVTVSGGGSQTFNAPFLAPVNYSFVGLTSDGTNHGVTATFSADPTCTQTSFYTAPANCTACPPGGCGTTIMVKN